MKKRENLWRISTGKELAKLRKADIISRKTLEKITSRL